MSRKRPSFHSEEQFAVFLEKMPAPIDAESDSRFSQAVAKLIRSGSAAVGAAGGTRGDRGPLDKTPGATPDRAAAGNPKHEAVRAKLAAKPEFAAMESEARDAVDARTNLLTLLGNLSLSWLNNESLLIYVTMVLLEIDEPSAAVTFAALSTTWARTELIRRLLLIKVRDPAVCADMEDIIERISEADNVRNELLRFERHGQIASGDNQALDQKRLESITKACADLKHLNRDLWDLLPRLQSAVAQRSTQPASAK
jgi:hypothetical protein